MFTPPLLRSVQDTVPSPAGQKPLLRTPEEYPRAVLNFPCSVRSPGLVVAQEENEARSARVGVKPFRLVTILYITIGG